MVAREGVCDTRAGLVGGFEFVRPHLAFFGFPEPAFDEGLGFGVTGWPPRRWRMPCSTRRAVKAEPLPVPSVGSPFWIPVGGGRLFDGSDRLLGAAAHR